MKSAPFLITLLIFLILKSSYSQDKAGQIGLVLMDDLSANPLKYGVSYWLNNSVSLEAHGSFKSIKVNEDTGTSYSIMLGSLYHFKNQEILPCVGGRLMYSQLADGSEKYSDIEFDFLLGLEYFFNNSVSFGGEVQFNYVITDDKYSISGNVSDANIYQTKGYILLRLYL
jgi:hypothetical protein